jgi:PTS system ascorbate-specific IIC component
LYAFLQAITITAGVLVLIFGVRMFLAEIIPAFKGISDTIIPGARPALDVPVLFQFSTNAMLVGFVVTFISWNVGMVIAGQLFGIVAIPSMTGVFFGGAVAGIYGNAMAGRRGCIIASITQGLHWPIALALFYPVLPLVDFAEGISFLTQDIMVWGTLITLIGKLF